MVLGRRWHDARLLGAIRPVFKLGRIQSVVLLLKLAHLLDFLKIDNIACFHVVQVFDALTAEDRGVLTTVKMFNTLLMFLTEIGFQVCLVVFVVFINLGISMKLV